MTIISAAAGVDAKKRWAGTAGLRDCAGATAPSPLSPRLVLIMTCETLQYDTLHYTILQYL